MLTDIEYISLVNLPICLYNYTMRRIKAFSLLEVIVAMAVATFMLTALLSLEIKSTKMAAEVFMGIDTLPIAIEHLEELSRQNYPGGVSSEKIEEYEVVTSTKEIFAGGFPVTKINVEVQFDGEGYTDLSLFRFNF